MPRITLNDYKAVRVAGENKLKDPAITALIGVASRIIDRLIGQGLSNEVLTDAELYLSLHLGTIEDKRKEGESVAQSTVRFEGRTGLHLDATLYGQQLGLILGDKVSLLGAVADEPLKPASFTVVTANYC